MEKRALPVPLETDIPAPFSKSPERLLLAAVLENAVQDFRGCGVNKNQQTVSRARVWIFTSKSAKPFSFLWVCQELDLCPEITRKAIKRKCSNIVLLK